MNKVEKIMKDATTTQRVAFGLLCAMEVCADKEWRTWAENWLNGKDRSIESAWAVAAESRAEWVAARAEWVEWAAAFAA